MVVGAGFNGSSQATTSTQGMPASLAGTHGNQCSSAHFVQTALPLALV